MNGRSRRVFGLIALAIGCVVGGCSPGTATPGADGSSPTPSGSAPAPAVGPSMVVPSSRPAGTPTPPVESDAPVAFLVVGADRYAGEVGGFTFGTLTQSAPWLPATALDTVNVSGGTELRVELDDRATIADWVARLATAADVSADSVTGLAEGTGPIAAFAAPSAGNWVLSLTITYGNGLGSGAYFWHVLVR